MNAVIAALSGLTLGQSQTFRNLTVFPLIGEDHQRSYLLLDEALEQGLAEITEVSQGGSVPTLAFENKSGRPILLVEGEELRGAKQNRVLNLTIFVGPNVKIDIPVSCVEQSRWAYNSKNFMSGSNAGGGVMFAKGRSANYSNVSASLSSSGSAVGNQGDVWDKVGKKLTDVGVHSNTMSMGDAYTQTADEVKLYVEQIKARPLQRGAVFCIDGKPVGLEVFDAPDAFEKFLTKLVRSYALDAIETDETKNRAVVPLPEDVARFVEASANAWGVEHKTVGDGESVRWSTGSLNGGARIVDGRALHVASFAAA